MSRTSSVALALALVLGALLFLDQVQATHEALGGVGP
jgi:hypothetical protein